MILHDETLTLTAQGDVLELYPFGDCHIGKRNCSEMHIRQQVRHILQRARAKGVHVRVLYGGDVMNQVIPKDIKRFDFEDVAEWMLQGTASEIAKNLSDMPSMELRRTMDIFAPLKPYSIGAISGNHEDFIRKHFNYDIHERFCDRMGIPNLSDEALIRLRFKLRNGKSQVLCIYIRHGYGSGRAAGAEPNKLERLVAEWEVADICLSGHTHTFCKLPPKPVLYVPRTGKLPNRLLCRYRYAANWGSWLLSHQPGAASYESRSCYPARPMVSLKIVIEPFRRTSDGTGSRFVTPCIRLEDATL